MLTIISNNVVSKVFNVMFLIFFPFYARYFLPNPAPGKPNFLKDIYGIDFSLYFFSSTPIAICLTATYGL
tara:strand:- start:596 stop:805 length:210 start_codon:yes stop_codon:yes gene_type:complete